MRVQGACSPSVTPDNDDGGSDVDASRMGPAPRSDAGSAPDAGGCAQAQQEALGTTCLDDDDCGCAAPFCARMGAAPGSCTIRDCNTAPDDCPDGYRCFDLSAVNVEGVPPFCIAE